jgi:hypothetical protein
LRQDGSEAARRGLANQRVDRERAAGASFAKHIQYFRAIHDTLTQAQADGPTYSSQDPRFRYDSGAIVPRTAVKSLSPLRKYHSHLQ